MSYSRGQPLFAGESLLEFTERRRREMIAAIEAYDPDRLMNTAPTDLAAYFAERFRLGPFRLLPDQVTLSDHESQIDLRYVPDRFVYDRDQPVYAKGHELVFHIPFEGPPELLRYQAGTLSLSPTHGEVVGQEVRLRYAFVDADEAEVRRRFGADRQHLTDQFGWTTRDVESFDRSLDRSALGAIEARRQRILSRQNMVAALGFPLRARNGVEATYAAPLKRITLTPAPPPASTAPFRPEPTLSAQQYEAILGVLGRMADVMERSPSAFAAMSEEDLRTQFLVQLNGQFEAGGTAETFNGSGSTDILLTVDGRNVFIAECKFWKGPASLAKAVDQLLDYLTWRDTKAAILLFNRNKDFGEVVRQIPGVLEQHPAHKRGPGRLTETTFRYVLKQRDDANREVTVTVMAFDVPTRRSVSDRLRS